MMFEYTTLLPILPLFILILIVMNNGYVLKYPSVLVFIGFVCAVLYYFYNESLDVFVKYVSSDYKVTKVVFTLTFGALCGGFVCTGLLQISQNAKLRKIERLKEKLSDINDEMALVDKELRWAIGFGEKDLALELEVKLEFLQHDKDQVLQNIQSWGVNS